MRITDCGKLRALGQSKLFKKTAQDARLEICRLQSVLAGTSTDMSLSYDIIFMWYTPHVNISMRRHFSRCDTGRVSEPLSSPEWESLTVN